MNERSSMTQEKEYEMLYNIRDLTRIFLDISESKRIEQIYRLADELIREVMPNKIVISETDSRHYPRPAYRSFPF